MKPKVLTLADYSRVYQRQALQPLWDALAQPDTPVRLRQRLPYWQAKAELIQESAQQQQPVSICLLGPGRIGKSTLINALLEQNLLPVSTYKPCTATAIAVGYSPDENYQATVEFVSETSWQQELRQGWQDWHQQHQHSTPAIKNPPLWQLVRDKLMAIHQADAAFASHTPTDFAAWLEHPLPPAVRQAMEAGHTVVKSSNLAKFTQALEPFVSTEGCFWPLIQHVQVTGPFACLRDGIRLVDLPGLNDPNQAREAITHRFLTQANFIWLTFDSRTGLSHDVLQLIQSPVFMRQLVLDGKHTCLTLVGTRADDVEPEVVRHELKADSQIPVSVLLEQRNAQIRHQVTLQLQEVGLRIQQHLSGSSEKQQQQLTKLSGLLSTVPVYLVSALEYTHLKTGRALPQTRFATTTATQIPALLQYMQILAEQQGPRAHKKQIRNQVKQLIQEIHQAIATIRVGDELQTSPPLVRQTVLKQLKRSYYQLNHSLTIHCRYLATELEHHLTLFIEQVRSLFQDVLPALGEVAELWRVYPWQMLKWAVQNQGRYSRGDKAIDLIDDASQPMIAQLMPHWLKYFQCLEWLLRDALQDLARLGELHLAALQRELPQTAGIQQALVQLVTQSRQFLEGQIHELQPQLQQALQQHQSLLGELQVLFRQHMGYAFEQLVKEQDGGNKSLFIQQLLEHLEQVTPFVFQQSEELWQQTLGQLNQQFQQKFRSIGDHLLQLEGQLIARLRKSSTRVSR